MFFKFSETHGAHIWALACVLQFALVSSRRSCGSVWALVEFCRFVEWICPQLAPRDAAGIYGRLVSHRCVSNAMLLCGGRRGVFVFPNRRACAAACPRDCAVCLSLAATSGRHERASEFWSRRGKPGCENRHSACECCFKISAGPEGSFCTHVYVESKSTHIPYLCAQAVAAQVAS